MGKTEDQAARLAANTANQKAQDGWNQPEKVEVKAAPIEAKPEAPEAKVVTSKASKKK